MNAVLLFISVVIHVVYCEYPVVQEVPCERQNWPSAYLPAKDWKEGLQHSHQGEEEKDNQVKIADFFITLDGMKLKESAVLCRVESAAQINSFWFDIAGPKHEGYVENESFVFSDGVGIKNKLRLGIRSKDFGKEGEHENDIVKFKTRVQLYGTAATKENTKITCGAGPNGDICSNDNIKLVIDIRNELDTA
ncbi:uncharacterized protein LOC128983224 [Macrosteles quadrilineatus]|uniref:uncharacterized protein LOC128983224 n=1 Tax=Macrosteles quadrilineatus TaxID=74068 RepID=UPI0023E17612|nr:uncharacterized protein LOC128983224 [Macrosteles quadrilineatus]